MSSNLVLHHHGKSKVRVGRVWREGDVHHMVEWTVNTMLDSDMEHSFLFGDNTGMTATDTQKNTVSLSGARASSCKLRFKFAVSSRH
jgi:urate oxidase